MRGGPRLAAACLLAELAASALAPLPAAAQGPTRLEACHYPGLPPMLFSVPDPYEGRSALRVGGRPEVEVLDDQREGGMRTAEVDGYSFQFFLLYGESGPRQAVQVMRDGAIVVEATPGECTQIAPMGVEEFLGPPSELPLKISLAVPPRRGTPETETDA